MRAQPERRSSHDHGDAGTGLIEQMIALSLIAVVLLGLLAALGAAAQGVTIGRQRTLAVSLAKQAIENLQGADYINVATDLSSPGLATDPLVTGTIPNLSFENERLVPGVTAPYRSTLDGAGTTFMLRTFVSSVTPPSGIGYRRITVIVEWLTPSSSRHTMRFSSLVFPLDYTSYPASSGSAEAVGGTITLVGHLGGDTFDDVRASLAAARADTNSSTLRTSIGAAASADAHVDVQAGPVGSTGCAVTGNGLDTGECSRETDDSIADNDATTSTGNAAADLGHFFVGGSVSTPGGLTVVTPAGLMTSQATTDECGSCGFGDSDGVPWTQSSVATSTAGSAQFSSDHGVGSLTGSLWNVDGGWTGTAAVDHDTTGRGIVTATAQLVTTEVSVLQVAGAPAGFAGAVVVSGFTTTASTSSGDTLLAPTLTATAAHVQLWDDLVGGYRAFEATPGTAMAESATATFTVGDHVVSAVSRVQIEPSTFSNVGTAPRTDAVAQYPALLMVTVEVTITSTTTGAVTDAFSLVVDYGRISAHATWLLKAAT